MLWKEVKMIQYYKTENERLTKMESAQVGCWISMVAPSEQEIQKISKQYNVDVDILKAAMDIDERSRIDTDDGYTMILVNVPTVEEQSDRELYSTIPMSIIRLKDTMITVCSEDSPVLRAFINGKVKGFHTEMKSRFILQFLYNIATLYLQYLHIIDKKSDAVETELHKSTQN